MWDASILAGLCVPTNELRATTENTKKRIIPELMMHRCISYMNDTMSDLLKF